MCPTSYLDFQEGNVHAEFPSHNRVRMDVGQCQEERNYYPFPILVYEPRASVDEHLSDFCVLGNDTEEG